MRRPSLKQMAARQRNWAVRQLRGIYANCLNSAFTEGEQLAVLRVVDKALGRLGAEPETARRERFREGHSEPFAKTKRGFARRAERLFVRSRDRAWS